MLENDDIDDFDFDDDYDAAMNTWDLVKYPFTYTLEFTGGKYDVAIQKINREQYEYWSDPANEPYLEDMAMGHLNKDDIPDFAMIDDEMCSPKYGNVAFAKGCAMDRSYRYQKNRMLIFNEKNELIFEISLNVDTLTSHGIDMHLENSFSLEDLEPGTCVFSKTVCDVSDYMQFEIKLYDQTEFELSRLKINYSMINEDGYINSVIYDDKDLDDEADPLYVHKHGIEFYVHQA